MEILEMPVAEERSETTQWGATPPPKLEEQELDVLVFELWQEANSPAAADEAKLCDHQAARGHSSCL